MIKYLSSLSFIIPNIKKQEKLINNQEIQEPIEQVSDILQTLMLQGFKITVIYVKENRNKVTQNFKANI